MLDGRSVVSFFVSASDCQSLGLFGTRGGGLSVYCPGAWSLCDSRTVEEAAEGVVIGIGAVEAAERVCGDLIFDLNDGGTNVLHVVARSEDADCGGRTHGHHRGGRLGVRHGESVDENG